MLRRCRFRRPCFKCKPRLFNFKRLRCRFKPPPQSAVQYALVPVKQEAGAKAPINEEVLSLLMSALKENAGDQPSSAPSKAPQDLEGRVAELERKMSGLETQMQTVIKRQVVQQTEIDSLRK